MGSYKNNLKKQKGGRYHDGNASTRPDYNKPNNIQRNVLLKNQKTHKFSWKKAVFSLFLPTLIRFPRVKVHLRNKLVSRHNQLFY